MTKSGKSLPATVKQAVERLISELPLEKKARIAKTGEWNLMDLYFSLSVDIEDKFCLHENKALFESCRAVSGDDYFFAEEASYIIITELWKRLQRFYK
jgi:hypothetical protein